MPVIVVLGMHRSGTSLLSSILVDLGVNMGDNLFMRGKNQPYGHWEDRDFLALNRDILRAAGGKWNDPPSHERITVSGQRLMHRIAKLINEREDGKPWGWKDPRTCLTAHLYHHHLEDARYVYISRKHDDVIESLRKRGGGGSWDAYNRLCLIYEKRACDFIASGEKEYINVRYEQFMDESKVERAISTIDNFVGGNGSVELAAKRIKR